ncbi:helix-turn-helix domain-containing protein [Amycolatopsis anabasis]|uniref:helix-turn-helix domain-containing protein n=1 Tax=Amycolatopsis anabasis TaxID=1840409 RepID=UPI00131A8B07|nr:helix-turn-helix transcriptional regulator [Amycolatopsis anabasis]
MARYSVPSIRRLQLGRELRDRRHRAGLTLEQAAEDLDMSPSGLHRAEQGSVTVHPLHVRAMAELYRVSLDDLEHLMAIAREAIKRNHNLIEGVTANSYPALESEAVTVRNFQLATVPGLLQTEDYARALFTVGDTREKNRNLRIRMGRAKRLFGEDPLTLHAIVDETALVRPIVEPALLAAQMRHILEMSELPNITVQVVPAQIGMYSGLTGAFTVLTFPEDTIADIGYVDHAAGNLQLVKESQVSDLITKFKRLAKLAPGEPDSRDLVARLARDLST